MFVFFLGSPGFDARHGACYCGPDWLYPTARPYGAHHGSERDDDDDGGGDGSERDDDGGGGDGGGGRWVALGLGLGATKIGAVIGGTHGGD